MEQILNIGLEDLLKADVLFMRNNYFIGNSDTNFSYVLWHDKDHHKIILAKSSLNPKRTDLSYVSTYQNIEEYYEKDLKEHQEHIKYYKSGLFDQIEKFMRKNNKVDILKELAEERKEIQEKEKKEHELKSKYEEKIKEEDIQLKQEELFKLVRARILEIKRRKEEIYFPEKSLADIQEKINTKRNFTGQDIDCYAKNIIKMFWEDNIPPIVKIEEMLAKIMEIDLKERKMRPEIDGVSVRRGGYGSR